MDLDALAEFLARTSQDGKLSRGERSAFKASLDEHDPDTQRLTLLRNKVFDIARAQCIDPRTRQTLDWIESVIHLVADHAAQPATSLTAEVLFSPGEGCIQRLRDLLRDVRTRADICVFTITDDRISSAVLDAHKRGVDIRLLSDNDKSNDLGSDVDRLRNEGVPVRLDTSPYHMHHKFAIFDGRVLLNGSFNWTRSASMSNEENILLTDDERLIVPFRSEFERLWTLYAP